MASALLSCSTTDSGGQDASVLPGNDAADPAPDGSDEMLTADAAITSDAALSADTASLQERPGDGGGLFYEGGGPAACPSLARTPCWQALVQEYVALTSCFVHRTTCDMSGAGGDPGECGVWTDSSKTACTWSDGTSVSHDETTRIDIFKNSSGAECYRKQFTTRNNLSAVLVTFETRTYTVVSDAAAKTWTFMCPDGSSAVAATSEFAACNFRGVCCSFPTASCSTNMSP